MYISKIRLKNIRCFEEIEIDLNAGSDIRTWAVILGNNGTGKTTLLRSIAVGLCDRTSAAGLISDLQGEWVRKGSSDGRGTIEIELKVPGESRTVSSKLTIVNDGGRETIEDFDSPSKRAPEEDIFVCAYGAGRGIYGTRDYPKYRIIDSVHTLFDYEMSLQNSELTLRRIQSGGIDIGKILESIDEILMLSLGSTRLTTSGITINGPWGKFIPLGSVGDGYRSTLTWITDFLGWAMFHQGNVLKREELSGIILIDELEQHLHPSWQRKIISLLHNQFPSTQFIATSHSPVCASGLADLSDDDCRLVAFERADDEGPVKADEIPSLRGLRADQVLRSKTFGLPETRNPAMQEKLEQFQKLLLLESLSQEEEAELAELRNLIEQQVPGLAESEEDRVLERQLRIRLIEGGDGGDTKV